jgi:amino acid permease
VGNLGAGASLGLAYGAVYATPPIFNELHTPPTRGSMLAIGSVAFGVATVLYVLVGLCGYYTFGDKVI